MPKQLGRVGQDGGGRNSLNGEIGSTHWRGWKERPFAYIPLTSTSPGCPGTNISRFQGIASGTETTWKAEYLDRCGTDPMIQPIANGMFGAVIVELRNPLVKADREYVIVQSEVYSSPFDVDAIMAGKPKFVVFNGRDNRDLDEPLVAKPGELIRLHVIKPARTITPRSM